VDRTKQGEDCIEGVGGGGIVEEGGYGGGEGRGRRTQQLGLEDWGLDF